jgi:long-chain acyl-CoA synthetase
MAQEYIGDPVASRAFRDGWFYPGDLLARDESGRLSFHGRADDVINLNGIKILPSAIEDALSSHPDVIDVAAFAVRSNLHGAIPVAAIALAKSATDREPGHFVDFCRPILGLRGPRRVIVLDRLPRNEDGKLQRRELGLQ